MVLFSKQQNDQNTLREGSEIGGDIIFMNDRTLRSWLLVDRK